MDLPNKTRGDYVISKERVVEILEDSGVLMTGHFILTSGRHSDKYMQCAKILQYPNYTSELVGNIAESFKNDQPDVVIAPAVGAILVGYELARQLGVKNLFAERVEGAMTLRRDFSIKPGSRVIVAEDVTTTGGTVLEIIDLVKAAGGEVIGVGLLVDRSNGKVDFGTKTVAAYTADVVSYEPDNCPLCKEGKSPAEKPGSRGLK